MLRAVVTSPLIILIFGSLTSPSRGEIITWGSNWLYQNTIGVANGYDLTAFPNHTAVEASVQVRYIHKVDTKNGVLEASLVNRYWWTDSRLAYPASETNPDGRLLVNKKDIWYPKDLAVSNARGNNVYGPSGEAVAVYSTGACYISEMIYVKLACPMDATNFPFDVQHCKIRMESWMHSNTWISLKGKPGYSVVDPINAQSEEFKLIDGGWKDGPSETVGALSYTAITFYLNLERYPGFYVTSLLMPSLFLLVIQWCGLFVSRNAAPARVGLNMTVLLTLGALRIPVSSYVPVTESATWIGSFQASIFFMAGCTTMEYVIVNFIGSFGDRPASDLRYLMLPGWFSKCFFEKEKDEPGIIVSLEDGFGGDKLVNDQPVIGIGMAPTEAENDKQEVMGGKKQRRRYDPRDTAPPRTTTCDDVADFIESCARCLLFVGVLIPIIVVATK